MNEFVFWNEKDKHMEFLYGHFYADAVEGCDHLEDLTYIGGEFID